jgi:hypothetical protein
MTAIPKSIRRVHVDWHRVPLHTRSQPCYLPGALRLKLLFTIATLLVVITPSIAADFTYKEYAKESDNWKRGFVLGISQYLAAVPQPDEEAPYPVRNAYQQCFAGSTEVLLARKVETYVAKNPPRPNESMVRVVIRALFDLCRSEIERTRRRPPSGSR